MQSVMSVELAQRKQGYTRPEIGADSYMKAGPAQAGIYPATPYRLVQIPAVGGATWLICSMDPEEPDLLFGLCDPDLEFPEVGYTSLTALQNMKVPVRFRFGPRVLEHHMQLERDLHFKATHSLSVYAQAARHNRGITENTQHLEAAARMLDREHAKRT